MDTVHHESGDVCRTYLWAWGGVNEDRSKGARAWCGVWMAWLGEVVGRWVWVCFDGAGRGGSGACVILRAVLGGGDSENAQKVNMRSLSRQNRKMLFCLEWKGEC